MRSIKVSILAIFIIICTAMPVMGSGDAFSQQANYILPVSNSRLLTEGDIKQLTPFYINIARNEIYARHGYIFKNENYAEYFKQRSWYKPNTAFKESMLSKVEKNNALFLKAYTDKINKYNTLLKGSTASIDLNGDGKKDSIKLSVYSDGDEYSLTVNNSTIDGTGCNVENAIYLLDINSKDKYKELAITEAGPSSDYVTYFYYYDGKSLKYMGEISGDCGDMKLDGSGNFTSVSRGNVLQTWFYVDHYKMSNSHKIENIPQKYYRMNTMVTLKTSINVLKEASASSGKAYTLKTGSKAILLETDDKQWCSILSENGQKGWFKITDNLYINGKTSWDTFDGLNMAD